MPRPEKTNAENLQELRMQSAQLLSERVQLEERLAAVRGEIQFVAGQIHIVDQLVAAEAAEKKASKPRKPRAKNRLPAGNATKKPEVAKAATEC